MSDTKLLRQITQRLSLRVPQEEALTILADVLDQMNFSEETDMARLLGVIKDTYPTVEDFEREFPTLCFSLATGVGKTRLMGAFISYLYISGKSKNFFVLAPNTTIYQKLVEDFSRQSSPKYVFRGISQFAQNPPIIVTGDTWEEGRGVRGADLFGGEAIINIFNVDKINKEKGRIRGFRETLGESYFDYLAGHSDLVMLMDEAHRYRAKAAAKSIYELKPRLGIELTATPKTVGASPKPFRNVIYSYGLGNAMNDGYVKEPAVATRTDFDPKKYDREQLEDIMLKDGVFYHEYVRTELELYAKQNGREQVHPFMLVVAQDTTHARALREQIESDRFYDGAYKGKVAEVHSKQSGEESDEAMQRLIGLETSSDTEIVIHVNKLKEGWDVTNLYTIVPLRASASEILTEQTLGRGLRLPYGRRTGHVTVDTLTVIAHDRFDDVISRAKEDGSVVKMKTITLGNGGDVPNEKRKVVTVTPDFEQALTGSTNQQGSPSEPTTSTPQIEVERKIAARTFELVRDRYQGKVKSSINELANDETIASIVRDIEADTHNDQADLDLDEVKPDMESVVRRVTAAIIKNTIEIPEIVVIPDRDIHFWFEDFDLERLDEIKNRPVDGDILVQNLGSDFRKRIERIEGAAQEDRLENYLVRRMIAEPEVDYDSSAELLFKLAGQMVEHLRSYLSSDSDIENVLLSQGDQLTSFIMQQMRKHIGTTDTTFRVKMNRAFVPLSAQQIVEIEGKVIPLQQAATPLSLTKSFVFLGGAKSPFKKHKFDSDPERRFACLIDRNDEPEVLSWLKPALGQFQIEYATSKNYNPDFVVETSHELLIVEVKADNDLEDLDVLSKAAAAKVWVENANSLLADLGKKQWRYLLLPASKISENATFKALTV
jgi:type III restriction enzyme